jgi:hypothetical protein
MNLSFNVLNKHEKNIHMTELKIKTDSPEAAVILIEILSEVQRAETKYPNWPECNVKRAAIVLEEAGELIREANQLDEGTGSFSNLRTEAIQTAAMCIRLLKHLIPEKEDRV